MKDEGGIHPASGGWEVKEARTKRMGCLLGSGFLARGCLFFNNLEEVSHAMEVLVVWLGLDCMYRLLPLSSMAVGATQALKY